MYFWCLWATSSSHGENQNIRLALQRTNTKSHHNNELGLTLKLTTAMTTRMLYCCCDGAMTTQMPYCCCDGGASWPPVAGTLQVAPSVRAAREAKVVRAIVCPRLRCAEDTRCATPRLTTRRWRRGRPRRGRPPRGLTCREFLLPRQS